MEYLHVGQTVYWNDPTEVSSAGYYRIVDLKEEYNACLAVKGSGVSDERIITIRNLSGEREVSVRNLAPVNYEQKAPEYKLHDKDFYLRFAQIFNTRHYVSRSNVKNWIYKVYLRLTNQKWSYGMSYSEQYADFVTELLNAVSETGVHLRSMLPVPDIQTRPLAIYPQKTPLLRSKGALSLKSLIPKSPYCNPLYRGIGIMGEWAYATDGMCLGKIKDNRWSTFDGRIASYSEYEMVLNNPKYKPKYLEGSLPYHSVTGLKSIQPLTWTWDIQELNDIIHGVVHVSKNLDRLTCSIGWKFAEDAPNVFYNPHYFYDLLRILRTNGAKQVNLECNDPMSPLILRADNGNIGLVTPFQLKLNWIITTFNKNTMPCRT